MIKLKRLGMIMMALLLVFTAQSYVLADELEPKDLTEFVSMTDYYMYKGLSENPTKLIVDNGEKVAELPPLRVGDYLLVKFNWEVEDDAMNNAPSGSFFYFDLFDNQYITNGDSSLVNGDIVDPNNSDNVIGSYQLQDDGRLRMQLDDVSSGVKNGTFIAKLRIKAETDEYIIKIKDQEDISVVFEPKVVSSGNMGINKKTQSPSFAKSGWSSINNKIYWNMGINYDQLDQLFRGEDIDQLDNVIIVDKINKGQVLDKSYIKFRVPIYVPYVEKNADGDYEMVINPATNKPFMSTEIVFRKDINKSLLNEIPVPSGVDFNTFLASLRNTPVNRPSYAFFDNPDDDHDAAVIFVWGNSPGTNNLDGTPSLTYRSIIEATGGLAKFSKDLDDLRDDPNGARLTQEQIDYIKELYGLKDNPDPQTDKDVNVVGFSLFVRVTADVTSTYTNEATKYWDKGEIVKKSREILHQSSGATGSLSKISVKFEKIWEDGNENHKDDQVIFRLYQNGDPTDKILTLKPDGSNLIKGTFDELPMFLNGTKCEYSVKEENIKEGYTALITENAENDFLITNKKDIETVNLKVEKVWDEDGGEAVDHDPITVVLYKDNVMTATTLVLSKDNDWKGQFNNLIKREGDEVIDYSVGEISVEGYVSTVSGNMENGFTITNKKKPDVVEIEKINIKVEKVWDESGRDPIVHDPVTAVLYKNGFITSNTLILSENNDWKGEFEDLIKKENNIVNDYTVVEIETEGYTPSVSGDMENGFVLLNKREIERIDVKVEKIWDENGEGYVEHDPITVVLYKDNVMTGTKLVLSKDNNWKGEFKGLLKRDGEDLIDYSVGEILVNGYYSTISGDMDNGFIILNKKKPAVIDDVEKINVKVKKVWDENGGEPVDHDPLTVVLYKNGFITSQTLILSKANNWQGEFKNLVKKEANLITEYTVVEHEVEGYISSVSGDMENGFTLLNKKEVEKVNVKVEKIWDEDGGEAVEHDPVTIVLYKDNVMTDTKLVLSKANNWKGEFKDLVKKDGLEIIDYSIGEISVEGYVSSISGDARNGFEVTNKKKPAVISDVEKINIKVQKVWDENGGPKAYHDQIVAVLYKNGFITSNTLILNEANNWQGEFKDLVKKEEDIITEYTVVELEVEGYTSSVSGDMENGFILLNKREEGFVIKDPEFTIDEVPNPNGDTVPDTIIVVDKKGTPLGKYTRQEKGNEFEWVDENGTPLGKFNVVKTGDSFPYILTIIIAIISLAGFMFFIKKRLDLA